MDKYVSTEKSGEYDVPQWNGFKGGLWQKEINVRYFIQQNYEPIVGLQTEAPLKRAIMPNGGFRMVLSSLKNMVTNLIRILKNGMPVTLKKATEELRKYRAGLKVMGGGFTLSGGEPLMQDSVAEIRSGS